MRTTMAAILAASCAIGAIAAPPVSPATLGRISDEGFNHSEVAETAGGAQAAVLAAVADRAVFAPEAASDLEAERVWRAVEELRASLDRGMTRWERIKADVSLRSFGDSRFMRFIARRAASSGSGTGDES